MKLFKPISLFFLLSIFLYCSGCQSKSVDRNEESRKENPISDNENINPSGDEVESEPVSCMEWIGFYGKSTRDLDSIVSKKDFKIKREGHDEYGSANKLVGAYVLTNKNMPIEKIGNLAKYLAYKLCLSDNKEFSGAVMNCERRKIQVVIARSEKNYSSEAWAVVYNIFPANKKGDLLILDYTK